VFESEGAVSLEPLLTLDEAALILKVSKSWVENQIRLGRLPKTKLGKIIRIEPSDLRAFIDRHKAKGVEENVTTLRIEGDLASGQAKVQVIDSKES
jgi:excisionase family DNA binding protein